MMKNIPVKWGKVVLTILNMLRSLRTSRQEHDGGFGVGFMGQPIGILSFITLLMSTQD